jgi:hypothetical protein
LVSSERKILCCLLRATQLKFRKVYITLPNIFYINGNHPGLPKGAARGRGAAHEGGQKQKRYIKMMGEG